MGTVKAGEMRDHGLRHADMALKSAAILDSHGYPFC